VPYKLLKQCSVLGRVRIMTRPVWPVVVVPRNLVDSTSWNPQGLSRPVMGLLLFDHTLVCVILTRYYQNGITSDRTALKFYMLKLKVHCNQCLYSPIGIIRCWPPSNEVVSNLTLN
jgi:hypothetical protein